MSQYIANRDGYIGKYIRAGETFSFEGKKPSWASLVKAPDKGKTADAGNQGKAPDKGKTADAGNQGNKEQ